MAEIPVFLTNDEITIAGNVSTIELQIDKGSQGQRGSRIFTGDAAPNTLPPSHTYFGGVGSFVLGDTFFITSGVDMGDVWEFRALPGGNEWVRVIKSVYPSANGGSFDGTWSTADVTSSGTLVTEHAYLLVRGAATLLELPQSADHAGKVITVKNLAGHPVTLITASDSGILDHIDGELSSLLLGTTDSISLLADDSGWVIV